ncbi:MAG: membrane peptidoglycan carboxypeptidase [Oceanicoccus sp.]|jgi:membrane peptidoglycan carboxypeptidase
MKNRFKKGWHKRAIKKSWKRLRPQPHMSRFNRNIRYALIAATSGALALGALTFVYAFYLIFALPNPGDLRNLNLTESTLIMDREGNLLYAIHGEENRKSLDSLGVVSPWLIDATIAIEDDQFYNHIGIDIPGLVKAVLSEFGVGTPRGGSTITQQFVKNTFLSSERSYKRKFQEIIMSLMVEFKFSKDEIMLMYLNAIPYGSNAYGIELAAERYFEIEAEELSLAQSAILAGIPKAPTRYSPYGNYRYVTLHFELTEEYLGDRVITSDADLEYGEFTRGLIGKEFTNPDGTTFYIKGRSDLVLDRMLELEFVSQTQYDEALQDIQILEFVPYKDTIKAPHFVLMVKQMLEEKYGTAVVEQGGLKVYTTLDPDFQEAAETAVSDHKESNTTNYDAGNSALVSIHPDTGQILAMVGSADYFDDEIDGQVNMVTSNRQPGSSFKPFVYALTFLNQFYPATVLYDVPTSFGTDKPSNYDGDFLGPLSIREALAQSRNIPAAKAYFMAGQEDEIVPFVQSFGMDSVNENGNYGWPLALGTAEVTPLELAEAYMVFASGGIHTDPTPILKVENADGEVLEMWEEKNIERTQVLDEQVAFLINDILSDQSVGLGPMVRLESIDNAAKTGTSNKKFESGLILPNNTWLAAYTPSLVTITWAGNADGSAMNGNASGYSTAAPIWKDFMSNIIDRLEPTEWAKPAEIKEYAVSRASGKLAGANTPSEMITTEVFASFAIPTEVDDSFEIVKIESVTGRRATEYSPEEFVEEQTFRVHRSPLADTWPGWQEDIQTWAANLEEGDESLIPPANYSDDIHNAVTAANAPEITIISPLSLSAINPDDIPEIEVEILSEGNGLDEVVFMVNDNITYRATSEPYSGKIRIPTTASEGTVLDITVKIYDEFGYSGKSSIQLRIGNPDEIPEPEEDPIEEEVIIKEEDAALLEEE